VIRFPSKKSVFVKIFTSHPFTLLFLSFWISTFIFFHPVDLFVLFLKKDGFKSISTGTMEGIFSSLCRVLGL
jgi:hypothetical protein